MDDLLRVFVERLTAALPVSAKLVETIRSTAWEASARHVTVTHEPASAAARLRRLVALLGDQGTNLLIVLDELPTMARALAKSDGAAALDLLRTLRALRHEQGSIRFVFAGSIGFHHVRHNESEVAAALNDLESIRVGPLSHSYAVHLARCLLLGIGVETSADDAVATAIAAATDGVPFYAHKLVGALDQRREARLAIDAPAVWGVREAAISQVSGDPWELGHYESRIDEYYGAEAGLAKAVVDVLAREREGALDFATVLDRIRLDEELERAMPHVGRHQLASVVRRLGRDDYVERSSGDTVSLVSAVLRDGWRAVRFLG